MKEPLAFLRLLRTKVTKHVAERWLIGEWLESKPAVTEWVLRRKLQRCKLLALVLTVTLVSALTPNMLMQDNKQDDKVTKKMYYPFRKQGYSKHFSDKGKKITSP